MPSISIRHLADNASKVVRDVHESGRPAIVTNRGVPVAALVPLSETQVEDWLLAHLPEMLASYREADEDIAAGRTVPLEDVL